MKILFLNYEYPPLGGGAGNATQYLLEEYAKMPDLEVHLVTSSVDGAYHHFPVGAQVTVHSVPIGKSEKNLHYQSVKDLLMYSWKGYRLADRMLSEGGYDALHAFFTVPCGYMAIRLGKKHGVPYIVSLRGADVPGYSERFTAIYFFLKPLFRSIWRHAASVVSNSAGLRELALQTDPKQAISIIPNGVDIGEFKPPENKEIDGYVRILCVSRLTPRKGVRYLIRAMKTLVEKDASRKIELWIVGEGDEMASLKQLSSELGISGKVKFFGRVEHDKLAPYYQVADIFCLPSLNEGMSNTMLEAIASGMPVVATVTGGTEELVRDGENGLFVAQQSAEDLAEKLERLTGDEALRKRFGAMSRGLAEEMSWKKVAERYAELYRKAII